MHPFARSRALGLFALLLATGGCHRGEPEANQALASLDTRLTQGESAAVPKKATATPRGTTLGALARAQHEGQEPVSRLAAAAGRPVDGCAGRGMRYGEQWAAAMPEGLGLYPGARLVEAAGTDTGRCALRAVSFTTGRSPEEVVAWYIEKARAAGFDAERQPCRAEIRLGGTRARDDAAYMLFARRRNGVTEVDVVASAGTRT